MTSVTPLTRPPPPRWRPHHQIAISVCPPAVRPVKPKYSKALDAELACRWRAGRRALRGEGGDSFKHFAVEKEAHIWGNVMMLLNYDDDQNADVSEAAWDLLQRYGDTASSVAREWAEIKRQQGAPQTAGLWLRIANRVDQGV